MPNYDLKGSYDLKSSSPYGNPNQSTDIDNKTLTKLTATINSLPAQGWTLTRPITGLQADKTAEVAADKSALRAMWEDLMPGWQSGGTDVIYGTLNGDTVWVRFSSRVDPWYETQFAGIAYCATGPTNNAMVDAWTQLHDDIIPPAAS